MIGWLLRLFFRPWGLIVLGILIMNFGWLLVVASQAELPERAALKQVAGVLDTAIKITSSRSRSVNFELEIKSVNGDIVKLKLPEREIAEDQVKRLLGWPVVALYSVTNDVWELSSGAAKIIEYDVARQRHVETKALEAKFGPYVGGAGLLVCLLGFFWLFHRRRRTVAA